MAGGGRRSPMLMTASPGWPSVRDTARVRREVWVSGRARYGEAWIRRVRFHVE